MPGKKLHLLLLMICAFFLVSASSVPRDDRGGFPFEVTGIDGTPAVCNGVFVSKHPEEPTICEFAILTAAHCLENSKAIKIDGISYDVKDSSRTSSVADTALIFLDTACQRFGQEQVYSIQTKPVPERMEISMRKSLFWNRQPSSLGYGSGTPDVAGKQIRGVVTDEYEGRSMPGFRYFRIAGSDTIESGDSGSPIFYQGEVVGVLSGSNQKAQPPFSVFLFAAQDSMAWAAENLRIRYLPMRTRR